MADKDSRYRDQSDDGDSRSGGRSSRDGGRPGYRGRGRSGGMRRRRVCQFCAEKVNTVDYKDIRLLQQFVAPSGRINGRRRSGTCAKHQRMVSRAIKRARFLALLPYAPAHARGQR